MNVDEVRVRPAICQKSQRGATRRAWQIDLLFVCIRLVVEDEEQGVEFHFGHFLGQVLIDHGRVWFLRVIVWRWIRVLGAVVVGPGKA